MARRHEYIVIALGLLLTGIIILCSAFDAPSQPVTVKTTACEITSSAPEKALPAVNVNTAGIDELITLNGIGEKKAQAIIDYRSENGPFVSLGELCEVSGIGEEIIVNNSGRITVG